MLALDEAVRAPLNTIAVELHQSVATSSDISFDFALVGQVFPANRAPTADAGPDITLPLGTADVLAATFADDGLPSPPGLPSFTWSKVDGPGTVTFADARSPRTTATFSEAGTYVLRFKAYDGAGAPGEAGDTDAGCALGAVMNGASGTFQITFGTLSSTGATGNEILVRIRLNAGQSITGLSFSN